EIAAAAAASIMPPPPPPPLPPPASALAPEGPSNMPSNSDAAPPPSPPLDPRPCGLARRCEPATALPRPPWGARPFPAGAAVLDDPVDSVAPPEPSPKNSSGASHASSPLLNMLRPPHCVRPSKQGSCHSQLREIAGIRSLKTVRCPVTDPRQAIESLRGWSYG